MHADIPEIKVDEQLAAGPLTFGPAARVIALVCLLIGVLSFTFGFSLYEPGRVWGSYYVSLLFFMGASLGGVVIAAIFQIVRARWSASLRRIAEAHVAFLPCAFVLFLVTWFGRTYLFPWATTARPGTEWWMQPGFVYARFAVLFLILFSFMGRFVWLSLREDVGVMKERNGEKSVTGLLAIIGSNWQGSDKEIPYIQNLLSRRAPLLIIVYGVVYSLFTFEMVMAMDKSYMSNLLGAFFFVGNVYISWAILTILTAYLSRKDEVFRRCVSPQLFWDIGKLTFGFCMLWGYFFLSQFLPQWYGNLPEETQWLILRTRDYPWKGFAYFTFGACFVVPFIVLLSREVKRNPVFLVSISSLILLGVWCEKYTIVMPFFSAHRVPINLLDVGIFLGFFGLYSLVYQWFLKSVPRIAVGHPLTRGVNSW